MKIDCHASPNAGSEASTILEIGLLKVIAHSNVPEKLTSCRDEKWPIVVIHGNAGLVSNL
jgi:hypothetical protein